MAYGWVELTAARSWAAPARAAGTSCPSKLPSQYKSCSSPFSLLQVSRERRLCPLCWYLSVSPSRTITSSQLSSTWQSSRFFMPFQASITVQIMSSSWAGGKTPIRPDPLAIVLCADIYPSPLAAQFPPSFIHSTRPVFSHEGSFGHFNDFSSFLLSFLSRGERRVMISQFSFQICLIHIHQDRQRRVYNPPHPRSTAITVKPVFDTGSQAQGPNSKRDSIHAAHGP